MKQFIREAEQRRVSARGTVLFCGEVHRFNRPSADRGLTRLAERASETGPRADG